MPNANARKRPRSGVSTKIDQDMSKHDSDSGERAAGDEDPRGGTSGPASRRLSDESPGSRPRNAPDFALSHHDYSLRSQGVRETFDDPDEAAAALRSGSADIVVGAAPFDARQRWALTVPRSVLSGPGPLEPPAFYRNRALPSFRLMVADPSKEQHRERVAAAVAALNVGVMDKVVLARREFYQADAPFDPRTLAARLMDASADGDGFLVDLSPAGPGFEGHHLVGSSPELLVRKQGAQVTSFPLAGSAARSADPHEDAEVPRRLRGSAKNLAEHRFVVDHIVRVLSEYSEDVRAPDLPEVVSTRELWHLGTPITATVDDPQVTALDLARALHPTPAIGGTPSRKATDYILSHEENRRFYSGAVGWCRADGDGMYMVSIRCGETESTSRSLLMWAGGGIVADSDPDAEVTETAVKLRTLRRVIGVADDAPTDR